MEKNDKEKNADAMVQNYLDMFDQVGTVHYYERLIRLVADASYLAGERFGQECERMSNAIQNSKVH